MTLLAHAHGWISLLKNAYCVAPTHSSLLHMKSYLSHSSQILFFAVVRIAVMMEFVNAWKNITRASLFQMTTFKSQSQFPYLHIANRNINWRSCIDRNDTDFARLQSTIASTINVLSICEEQVVSALSDHCKRVCLPK